MHCLSLPAMPSTSAWPSDAPVPSMESRKTKQRETFSKKGGRRGRIGRGEQHCGIFRRKTRQEIARSPARGARKGGGEGATLSAGGGTVNLDGAVRERGRGKKGGAEEGTTSGMRLRLR
ncbi:hypothetical protein KM043_016123 [Ampulex compressa]|nr:hypothetical protein KM043_016123 [Ampulex compressa]